MYKPTGILFAAQIKSTTSERIRSIFQEVSPLNGVSTYTLSGANKTDQATLTCWTGLGVPAYFFIVVEDISSNRLDCYYKRCTPLLDGIADEADMNATRKFYLVNLESAFLAFADFEKGVGGVARDLVIDYARGSYSTGHIVQLAPNHLRFWPFPRKNEPGTVKYFGELIEQDEDTIKCTCAWTAEVLRQKDNAR